MGRFINRGLLIAAISLALLPTRAAHAQQKNAAAQKFEAGVAAYDAKEYKAALEAFEQAYKIKPHPIVRLNIANCQERLGRHTEAEEQYNLFLEEMPDSAKGNEVRRSLARISKRIGVIRFEVSPETAVVTVDGTVIDTRTPTRIDAGRYRIIAEADGFITQEQQLPVPGGSKPVVKITLLPDLTSANESDDAQNNLDDEAFLSDTGTGKTALDSPDDASRSTIPTGTWIAGGAAVALGAGALIVGLMAVSAESDFEDAVGRSNNRALSADERRAAVVDGSDAAGRADSLALTSDVLLLGAAAAAGTALVFILTDSGDSGSANETFTATPILGPSFAGASIRQSF